MNFNSRIIHLSFNTSFGVETEEILENIALAYDTFEIVPGADEEIFSAESTGNCVLLSVPVVTQSIYKECVSLKEKYSDNTFIVYTKKVAERYILDLMMRGFNEVIVAGAENKLERLLLNFCTASTKASVSLSVSEKPILPVALTEQTVEVPFLWEFSIDTGLLTLSENLKEQLNLNSSEYSNTLEEFFSMIAEDDIEMIKECWASALQTNKLPLLTEYSFITPKGNTLRLKQTWIVLERNAGGNILRIGGTIINIEKEYTAVSKVNEHLLVFNNLLLNSPSIVFVTDTGGKILLLNATAEALLGTTTESVRGKKASEIFPGDFGVRYSVSDKEVLQKKKSLIFEDDFISADGKHHFITTKAPLLNPHGEIVGVCCISIDITGRKRLEEDLIKTREQYRVALAHLNAVSYIWYFNEDNYNYVGEGIEELTGIKKAHFTPSFWYLDTVQAVFRDEDPEAVPDVMLKKIQAGEMNLWNADYKVKLPSGEICWINDNAVPLRDEYGKVIGLMGTFQDITLRKRTELSLQEALSLSNLYYQASMKLNHSIDLNKISEVIFDTLSAGFSWDYGSFWLTDKDTGALSLVSYLSNTSGIVFEKERLEAVSRFVTETDNNVFKYVVQSGNSVRLANIKQSKYDAASYSETVSVLCVPVLINSVPIGCLALESSAANSFSLPQENLLEALASISSASIQNALLFEKQKNTVEKLKESEARYKTLFESANEGVVIVDLTGTIISANRQFCTITGITADELSGATLTDFIPEREKETVVSKLQELKNGSPVHLETFISSQKEKLTNVYLTCTPLLNNEGQYNGYFAIINDITTLRTAEEIILQNSDRLNSLLRIYEYQARNTSDLLDYALGEALALTQSKYGYIYYYHEDKKEFVLNSWSKDVMEECNVVNPQTCYELDKTGIWGEAARQRRDIIINDFRSHNELKKGYPEGHVTLTRFMTTPVMDNNQIVAVIGVANKETDYNGQDVTQLKILMNTVWKIVKRKEAEQNLKLMHKAIERNPVSVVVTDPDGVIQYVNPKFTELSGYTTEEILGKKPSVLKSDFHDEAFYKKLWDTVKEGKEFVAEFRNKKKNGELYWESSIISPLFDEHNAITHFIAVKSDITERKVLIEELIRAKDNAMEMNRLKTNFLANMSHELRTPLIGILGYSELLKEYERDDDVADMGNIIFRSGQRLLETLNLILDLSRIEAGKLEPDKTKVNIIPLVEDVVALFRENINRKNLDFNFECEYSVIYLLTDKNIFSQIVTNLLNNAIKFTEIGGITIIIRVEEGNAGKVLRLTVKDTGIGIDENSQHLIWEEFRQASEGHARSFEGTGLGLTITRNFLAKLGGRILLKSAPGVGSEFTIEHPDVIECFTREFEEEPENPADEYIAPATPRNRTNYNILLVENDITTQHFMVYLLNDLYHTDCVSNGEEALMMVKRKKYDLIIMDINLGEGRDGMSIVKILRSSNEYKDIPIAAITAFAMEGDREEFIAGGCTHYLAKPFTRDELLDFINGILPD